MREREILAVFSVIVTVISAAGGGTSSNGKWTVPDGNGGNCIMLNAEISCKLGYYKSLPDGAAEDAIVPVPGDATVTGSSCQETIHVDGTFIEAQVLQLNFPKNEGWNVRIAFTQDKQLKIDEGNYAIFQVNITANFTNMPDLFHIDDSQSTYTYYQPVDLREPPAIANTMFTTLNNSYYCSIAQAFVVNSDLSLGPAATITLKSVTMQAYSHSTAFGQRDTCAADQHEIDKVPIIVAGCLAGLIVFTLIVYLVYRCRLPPEIINLTAIEDDEKDHLHEHSNGEGAWGYDNDALRF